MKTNFLRLSVVGVFAAAMFAQNSTALRANIPFDFTVGSQQLEAGEYTVNHGPSGTVTIRSADRKAAATVIGQLDDPSTPPNTPRLIFHRYGSTYFLSEVQNPYSYGLKLSAPRREREMAASQPPPVITAVAAIHPGK